MTSESVETENHHNESGVMSSSSVRFLDLLCKNVSYFSKPHYSLRFHAASISFVVQNTLQVHVVMTLFCMFSMSGRWSLPLSLHPFSLLA